MARRPRGEDASAVVDFVLVMVLVIPIALGVIQVGLVLHVRNTLTSAASEGARYGATIDRSAADGVARTRQAIRQGLSESYARDVTARETRIDGVEAVVVEVRAGVPALGLFGPGVRLVVRGHAVREVLP
ncbi:MAG: pilus assembly protein [Actinomycetota bacterium]|nr:pilus assembly protein [Actinomycetota bacterium]